MNADDPPKLTGLTVQQMMDRVREDFQEKQYYVTGNFSSELFTDECVRTKRIRCVTLNASGQGTFKCQSVTLLSEADTFVPCVQLPIR
jgi:hypothetical protein